MISAGVEGRLPYMTYPEPWRGPPKQPPEFLRPAPKLPLPSANRYNGLSNNIPNGTRLAPPTRPQSKYSSPPAASPVNLTQHKEQQELPEDLPYSYPRLFSHPPPFNPYHTSPYALYQSSYPILRSSYVQPPPLSPLETTYSPTTPTSGTFLSPQSTFSPPSAVKPGQSLLRDRKLPPSSFKVPSGKEGSLKHRILTRPEDAPRSPLDLQRDNRKRLGATAISPPQSPAKSLNNNTVPAKFVRGSLISLATGELRRVEDMRTEDFVMSAEQSPELRLADSTVVRIEETPITGSATITLSYNQRRTQVEVESALEHPFFVYGVGWASCNAERTLQCYGLKVHRLQVGDVLISLTPRETPPQTTTTNNLPPRSQTTITTATTTAMTVRHQTSTSSMDHHHMQQQHQHQQHQQHLQQAHHQKHIVSNLIKDHCVKKEYNNHSIVTTGVQQHPNQSLSPDSLSRKRRWSAPDQICDEDEMQPPRRIRME